MLNIHYERAQRFLENIARWAAETSVVRAVGLGGSYARGNARSDSDVDLVIVVEGRDAYLTDTCWTAVFGEPRSIEAEDWGLVQSVRVFYKDGLEVEFGLTTEEWLEPAPGTMDVVRNGFTVLYDPSGRMGRLLA